jgi:hypothetical protein
MSEFVNYNKRNVDLPLGCKDFVDLLRQQGFSEPSHPHCSGSVLGKVADIEMHVKLAYDSFPFSYLLVILPKGEGFAIGFWRTSPRFSASVFVHDNPLHDHLTRDFFNAHHLSLIDNKRPELPWGLNRSSYEIRPLPLYIPEVSQLFGDLLRFVCQLNDESPVTFTVFASIPTGRQL